MPSSADLQSHLHRYVAHLRDDLGRSARTVAGYRAEIEQLLRREVPLVAVR